MQPRENIIRPKGSSPSKPVESKSSTPISAAPAVTQTRYGVVAITNASNELGSAIATQIGTDAKALLLIDRNKDRLQKLLSQMESRHTKLRIHPIVCDLNVADHRKRLIADLSKLKIDTLILNSASESLLAAYNDFLNQLIPTLDPKAKIQILANKAVIQWAQTIALELGSTTKITSIIGRDSTSTDFALNASKCIQLLEKPGTHFFSIRSKIVWALIQFLMKFLS